MQVRTTASLVSIALAGVLLAGCAEGAAEESGAESGKVDTGAPLYDALPKGVKDAGELVVVGDAHPPYRTVEKDGEVTGIDPDLWKVLGEQLGVPVRMEVSQSMPSMLTGMQSGRWQAWNGPVQANPERERSFDAITWLQTRTAYVFSKEGADGIAAEEAPCGQTIALVGGSITESEVEKLNTWCAEQGEPANKRADYADTNATLLAVKSGRADVAGMTETAALDVTAADETYDYVTQTDEQGSGVSLLALLTPKDSGMGKPLYEAFQNIFDNGDYQKVLEEWGLEPVAVEKPLINPTTEREPS
ncbi:polar amino acid transport system substrate-binding protein [Nocardioides albertanoniae]|uniref:Polar amino acid transport system substrate-binding protein n=1 Tax=Nocardioides albertanoniae TaxID=1175486 RepID=A0A543A255_9ACTN|nr:transporter substrate-binding domain-containing protein [Nocardioides albertanoniae]TQL66672.1 polar amino acid transport system substrate-binding protein [Nocardioides albertanoniae]